MVVDYSGLRLPVENGISKLPSVTASCLFSARGVSGPSLKMPENVPLIPDAVKETIFTKEYVFHDGYLMKYKLLLVLLI